MSRQKNLPEQLVPVKSGQEDENDDDDDEVDDNQYFLSEPSVSDHSSVPQHRLVLPHGIPNSPGGNTSLSSWDASPALEKKVFLQFPKPVRRRKTKRPLPQAPGGGSSSGNTSLDGEADNRINNRASGGERTSQSDTATAAASLIMTLSSDESTERPPRIGVPATAGHCRPLLHRRNRSGDGAAATFMMGSLDWRGMNKDQIPLPQQQDDEEEEDGSHGPNHNSGNGIMAQQYSRTRLHQRHRRPTSPTPIQPPAPAGRGGAYGTMGHAHGSFSSTSLYSPAASSFSDNYPTQQWDSQHAWMSRMSQVNPSPPSQPRLVNMPPPPPDLTAPSLTYGLPPPRPVFFGPPNVMHSINNNHNNHGGISVESPTAYAYSQDYAAGDYCDDYSSDDGGDDDDDSPAPDVQHNRLDMPSPSDTFPDLQQLENSYENRNFRGSYQTVMRPHVDRSPFANWGKKTSSVSSRRSDYLPQSLLVEHDSSRYPTYICPVCGTRQREFFSVTDAPRQVEGPSGYLAVYFGIYVIASLFIFGLEEGWKPLDCIYFSVVTLTTAGLGDFVPTSDANKMICSIFIYFGVACIGLLLGSYIAGILDERASRDREAKLIQSCPNCARMRTMDDKGMHRRSRKKGVQEDALPPHRFQTERSSMSPPPSLPNEYGTPGHLRRYSSERDTSQTPSPTHEKHHPPPATTPSPMMNGNSHSNALGSPSTTQILGRQKHTRHQSFDIRDSTSAIKGPIRKFSADLTSQTPTISETTPLNGASVSDLGSMRREPSRTSLTGLYYDESTDSSDDSSVGTSSSSVSSSDELLDEGQIRIKTAKYVFLTLRQALVNSMVIIAVGSVGFYIIEDWTLINSWYFTTVFLTTVGYGDIVPVTKGGKLFATVYILVAGTILLNNMSSISLIPLELRRRRLQQAVLTQFGDELDDAALHELATGPVIERLHLAGDHPDGLQECTREMFSLAMLVRMGKVSEEEIRQSFAAFRRLDVSNEGVLNSKSIIAAMIQKRRAQAQQTAVPVPPPLQLPPQGSPPREPFSDEEERSLEGFWVSQQGSLHVSTPHHSYVFGPQQLGAAVNETVTRRESSGNSTDPNAASSGS